MKHPIFITLSIGLLLSGLSACSSSVEVTDLRCEYRINPLGIDNTAPRLSWKMLDAERTRGQKQRAYHILVASQPEYLKAGKADLWDSGKRLSGQSVNKRYEGAVLESNQDCYWTVRVWDKDGRVSRWSDVAHFSVGLLNKEDWQGKWIMKEDQSKSDHNWYRKTITLKDQVTSAKVYVGSFGYHELYINGRKVTDNVMNPVSSYMKKRIPYLTYDVAEYLEKGDNVIAIWHAAGWARWRRIREYRNIPFAFKAQIEIAVGDERMGFGTDESWKCKKSHSAYYGDWDILRFGGETIDDRLREDDWNAAGYDDSDWSNAVGYNHEKLNALHPDGYDVSIALNSNKNRSIKTTFLPITAQLSAQMVEPQVKYKAVNPIAVKDNRDGSYRIDMGENYTGFFEMDLYNGTEGDSVLFEISDQTAVVMNWKQKSKYIYGKSGKGTFTNRFNYGAGRWVTVYGLSYKPKLKDIKGYVITNDRRQISQFESSNELMNQIYQVNLNTYIANTIDGILVDCPHRERRAWGEVTVAAMYGDAFPNFESGAYMDQYSQYMRDAQFKDGQMRAVLNEEDRPFLMWKANSPITIWETYKMMGDKQFLADNYASMRKWMEWLYEHSDYESGGALKIGTRGLREMPGLGDWCTPRDNFWDSSNSPEAAHFNNCTYAYMLQCAQKMAEALGNTDDALTYATHLKVQQKATHEQSYDAKTGKYLDGRQVNQAFALLSGVTPEAEREKVSAQLENNMLYTFPYYDTGSSGQALYNRFFAEYGERMDLIYELLQDCGHPSYGYFIQQGHSTWPERWSAVGNSQIHTCYTGIGAYFIKGFGGIRPGKDAYGMQHFIIKPTPLGDLTFANTSFESMYGTVVVNWNYSKAPFSQEEKTARYHIEIPPNCSAKVYLPARSQDVVRESGTPAEKAEGVTFLSAEKSAVVGNYIVYRVAAGAYDFAVSEVPLLGIANPLVKEKNRSKLARATASSMYIETEKLPGFEAFKSNDEDMTTAWQAAEKDSQYLEMAWVKPQSFSKVVIKEQGDNIQGYKIQYFDGRQWQGLAQGKRCGKDTEHRFKAVTASKCRLLIEHATAPAMIAEFEIY